SWPPELSRRTPPPLGTAPVESRPGAHRAHRLIEPQAPGHPTHASRRARSCAPEDHARFPNAHSRHGAASVLSVLLVLSVLAVLWPPDAAPGASPSMLSNPACPAVPSPELTRRTPFMSLTSRITTRMLRSPAPSSTAHRASASPPPGLSRRRALLSLATIP